MRKERSSQAIFRWIEEAEHKLLSARHEVGCSKEIDEKYKDALKACLLDAVETVRDMRSIVLECVNGSEKGKR